jgi:radical SAM superfamily enzyme YgiQ (UPF0313 family)
MHPLAFALLRSLTPPDVEVVLHDERIGPIPLDEATDLVAMTVETYTARRAYQLASSYRRRGVPVVMGGYHPTFLPDECAPFADAVVIGDAEAVWPAVVSDARRGRLRAIYRQGEFPPLAGRPPVDRSIFAGKYAPVTLQQARLPIRATCSIHFYGPASVRWSVKSARKSSAPGRGWSSSSTTTSSWTCRRRRSSLPGCVR